ncbi:MAG: hypothetical protein HXX17_06965 [Geobacteraceae bacterium]|nr:hypothetical protein [Geobacteraceae bacterium]
MIRKVLFIALLGSYVAVIVPFSSYLGNRSIVNKLGYMPEAEIVKFALGDLRYLASQWAVFKVMLYFGGMVDNDINKLKLPPEYPGMSRMISNAVRLDPYNMDAYYLAQATFVWDVKDSAKEINKLLIYGMRYRTWDYYLPFFAGFNSAYFLHDYNSAAEFMKKAAELSGDPLFTTLSARYFHEAGRTELGIMFIDSMEHSAKDEKVRTSYHTRKEALLNAQKITDAVNRYREKQNVDPNTIEELISKGFLNKVPVDPYGGKFYLSKNGRVESTSKFAFGGQSR